MGVPGVLVSLLHEVSSLPGLKDSGLPGMVDQLYTKQRIDLRREIPLYKAAAKQTLPVLLNEAFVRTGFFLSRLAGKHPPTTILPTSTGAISFPLGTGQVDRMLAISSMTFSIADTADAATRAAMESGANWILLAGRMTARINYVGAGRATIAIAKEIDNESKETKLLHEKIGSVRNEGGNLHRAAPEVREKPRAASRRLHNRRSRSVCKRHERHGSRHCREKCRLRHQGQRRDTESFGQGYPICKQKRVRNVNGIGRRSDPLIFRRWTWVLRT